jgi:phosphoribosylformimino-5-aminoimidazole carboxamide ribotide isomerase
MIILPAVDLREGACVQLIGGDYALEKVRLADPVAVARDWARQGFPWLHVVDLDAATGRGSNHVVVEEILREGALTVQVGGGVRSADRIAALLDLGAERVVIGTRAIEEPEWLEEMADQFPDVLVVAADVWERSVVTRGWARQLTRHVRDVILQLSQCPLAGVLVTAVHKEGQMLGVDIPLMDLVVDAADVQVFASGGVGTIGDLRALADTGVDGCVVGMALYTGAVTPRAALELMEETAE